MDYRPKDSRPLLDTGCQGETNEERSRKNLFRSVEMYATHSIALWVTVEGDGWLVELFHALAITPPDNRFSLAAHFDEWETIEKLAPYVSRIYVSGFEVELGTPGLAV